MSSPDICPRNRGLYRKMRVRPLLEFFGELRGGRKVSKEVAAWLERLDLAHCAAARGYAEQGHEPAGAVHRGGGTGA